MSTNTIESVLESHRSSLSTIKGVVGVDVDEWDGKPCIKVMIDKRTRKLVKQIPKSVEGYTVIIEETGEFKSRRRTPPY